MTAVVLTPVSRADARAAVKAWHSTHEPHVGERWADGAVVGGQLVAVVVVGRPVSPQLQETGALEVTRLAVGPDAPHCCASKLLGLAWARARLYRVRRLVSYTRTDEAGTCYRAAGWVPVALVKGRLDAGGNRALRWLPGLRAPSTETIDRVRWEIGPDAATTRVRRDSDGVWRPVPQEDAAA